MESMRSVTPPFFHHGVVGVLDLVERKAVLEAGAAAALNEHAQLEAGIALFVHQLLDLRDGGVGEVDGIGHELGHFFLRRFNLFSHRVCAVQRTALQNVTGRRGFSSTMGGGRSRRCSSDHLCYTKKRARDGSRRQIRHAQTTKKAALLDAGDLLFAGIRRRTSLLQIRTRSD